MGTSLRHSPEMARRGCEKRADTHRVSARCSQSHEATGLDQGTNQVSLSQQQLPRPGMAELQLSPAATLPGNLSPGWAAEKGGTLSCP